MVDRRLSAIRWIERDRERLTSLAFALAISGRIVNYVVLGGVTGHVILAGDGVIAAVVVGALLRLLVLREIVQTHALPHGVDHHAHAEEHDLSGARRLDGGARASHLHRPLRRRRRF